MTFDPTRPATPEPFTPAVSEPSAVPTAPVVEPSPGMAPAPALPTKRKGSGGGWVNAVLVIAAAVAIGGVAFAVGRSTAPTSAVTAPGLGNLGGGTGFPTGSFAPGANGVPGFAGGGLGGGGLTISGTVDSVDGDSLTITTAAGQTIEITTDTSTSYTTQAPASASDVQVGSTVQVQVQVDGAGGFGRPGASPATSGPIGTAGSVTVVP